MEELTLRESRASELIFKTALAEPAQDAVELEEEYAWLEGGQSYVACAFYTPNYVEQVTTLKRSLEAQGINHFFKRYQRRATWESTTRLKPVFVDYALKKFPDKDVLYLDADAVVRRPLTFFDDLKGDISMLFHRAKVRGKHRLQIAAGTVFVRNTEGGRRFAGLWKDAEQYCRPLTVDEEMVYMAFDDMAGISFAVLPPTYSKIFDQPGSEPVIEHFQASRQQFKWRRLLRRARRKGLIVGGAMAAGGVWWLSQHLAWVA
ncbi:MAG: hypothetical protein ACR2OV_09575 [Hyphomicrobiaceae bacterium]